VAHEPIIAGPQWGDKQAGRLLGSAAVRRVSVVGTSGAGKSTLFALDKEESVIAWAWQTHAATRAKLETAMADPANSHLRFVRLKNPAAVRRFLCSVSGVH
jgi:ATPase subunit of ABC transporter with duplicated ATPase domains